MAAVSVILPVHNGAAFLAEAIASVRAQTLNDWELIAVDDGSTDETPAILQSNAGGSVTILRQHHQGVAVARNRGLDAATGQYVLFLDADDFLLPSALADLAGFLDAHGELDVVYSDGWFCNHQGEWLLRLSDHRPAVPTGEILEPLVLSASVIVAIHCAMTRRSVIERHRTRFDADLAIGEDWHFWIELARHGRFGYLDAATCLYRVHRANITSTTCASVRRSDLVRGREKLLREPWFGELSLPTREAFFYNLLVDLLPGQRARQEQFCVSARFLDLPARSRARLLRLVATDYLLRRNERQFSRTCLEKAAAACPRDLRSRALLALIDRSYPLSVVAVVAWRGARRLVTGARSLGRRKPQPVPAGLRLV